MQRRRQILILVLAVLGVVLVLPVLVLLWAVPMDTVPPTGSQAVGTRTWTLEDADRVDPLADVDGTTRRFPVQAWYPTVGNADDIVQDAAVAEGAGPLVVFVHGATGVRRSNTSLYVDLASHGYVVIAADHTHVAFRTTFPDGDSTGPSGKWNAVFAGGATPEVIARDPVFHAAVDTMTADVARMLDDAPSRLGAPADRVAVVGHSLGGMVALDFCSRDARCAAVVDLDGPPMAWMTPEGGFDLRPVPQPLLVVRSAIQAGTPELAPFYDGLHRVVAEHPGPAHEIDVAGAGHLDLTDLPLLIRPTVGRLVMGANSFGTGDPKAKIRALDRLVLGFLDRHMLGKEVDLDAIVAERRTLAPASR